MELTAEEIRELLGLQPHPTCGFVEETYRSRGRIPAESLPPEYAGSRPYGSALYFLVTPDAHIELHRIRSDQQYHHYLGDPLEVLLLFPDGSGAVSQIGSDLRAGMRPMLFIPGGTFHMARLLPGGRWSLLSSTEWPGVEPPDVEHGDPAALIAAYPAMASEIRRFAGVR